MQFHLDGFRVGDPAVAPAARAHPTELPDEVDVLIVGSGPAGLVLAAQLAAFPQITTRLVERSAGPLELGRADGVACRTVEMFQAFGFAERLVKEAYGVNETVFWRPDPTDRARIVRTGRVQDVADDLSECPHVILNQARVHDYLLEAMLRSPTRLEPDYGLELVGLEVDPDGSHPVHVALIRSDGAEVSVRTKYAVGCDGARSAVRRAIGRELHGDAANHAWGVIDVLAVTDFPDIRLKAAIQSANHGTVLIIPREGGYLVRLYVDLGTTGGLVGDRDALRRTTADEVIAAARRVLHPYTLDVRELVWFSVYEVGQRLTDRFDDVPAERSDTHDPRVFIAGDACHTHSAKAGQGMNVSMQDAFNLGWKLAAVLHGRSAPSLLRTYSAERQPVAQELIDFDREWSAMMAAPPRDPSDPGAGGVDPAELQDYFVRAGRYTAGVATRYRPALLTGTAEHQHLAAGLPIGNRFHSAPVIRVAATADGRWRLYLFADPSGAALADLCDVLEASAASPIRRFTPPDGDPDAVIDTRAVFQQHHRDVDIGSLPSLLLPRKGRFGLIDYEKAFTAPLATGHDIYARRGIDRDRGVAVVVRPDQYVGHVLPLDAFDELASYFAGFLIEPR